MGVFNFMETFFFLSLGITFVLILLLVYHFKQRLTTVEAKSDTMFEIMNTMVKEMGVIKTMASRAVAMPPPFSMPPMVGGRGGPIPIDQVFSQFGQAMHPNTNLPGNVTILGDRLQTISDDEVSVHEDADADDADDDGSDGSDSDEGSESGEETENEEEREERENREDLVETATPLAQEDTARKIVVSDTEDMIDETTKPSPLDIEEVVDPQIIEEIQIEPVNEVVIHQHTAAVDTDDMSVISELSLDNTLDTHSKTMTDFRKMNLGELKQLALSKGLVQDAGKMKKKELLELLRTTVA